VIKSFRNASSRRLYEGKIAGGFGSLDRALALKRLDVLNAATKLADIPPLKSVGLHALKGNRAGQWPFRLIVRGEFASNFATAMPITSR
jgi:proteic killer suppression protein